MVFRPDVTVAAVIERDARFLLVEERIGGRRVFNQPAGHLEDGESLPGAVVREVLEETAWGFEPQWLLGIYLWRSPRGRSTLRLARARCGTHARCADHRDTLAHTRAGPRAHGAAAHTPGVALYR